MVPGGYRRPVFWLPIAHTAQLGLAVIVPGGKEPVHSPGLGWVGGRHRFFWWVRGQLFPQA